MKTTEVPPTIERATDAINVIPASQRRECLQRQLREYRSLAFSAALHAGILLVMAFCVLPVSTSGRLDLNAVFEANEEDVFEMADQEAFAEAERDASDDLPLPEAARASLSTAYELPLPVPEASRDSPEIRLASIQTSLNAAMDAQSLASSAASADALTGPSSAATSAEEAVDRVTGSIESKLQKGDLLVVWLLDASYSMADDRQRLATLLGPFLEQFAGEPSSRHQLLTAVASFGEAMRERVAPTAHLDTLENVSQLPFDASGKEYVFDAIEKCVAKYRRHWRDGQLMIVVWTDESGDDVVKLEDTIRICRDNGVSVSVVGPSAVLGAETGLSSFTDPESHQTYELPVERGPDSAQPERLELSYWFLTPKPQADFELSRGFGGRELPSWYGYDADVPGHHCVAATDVALPTWYGGHDLKGLASGFSPYALTRLTHTTGGTYVIFDQAKNGKPFPAYALRGYLPDYRSMEEYLHDVESHPLRHAVMAAAKRIQGKNLGPPPTMLFGKVSESPPYGFMRTYFTPAVFARYLRKSRPRLKARADHMTRLVEQALACVSESGSLEYGLEHEYQREYSRRWRAWYDLTRGRLLATSVRLEEYRLTCDRIVKPGFLKETTNHLIFAPALEMKSGPQFSRRAEEAERLLIRCERENPDTPWALLAQRELDYGLGIDVRQRILTHVAMPPSTARHPRIPEL